MDIDFSRRVEMLRLTVMRRAGDLVSEGDRVRFAENMAFVYRMDEPSVLAVIEDVLGLAWAVEPVAAPGSERRITVRELVALED